MLQPLNDKDTMKVANEVWKAIEVIPKHRHNQKMVAEFCSICIAHSHLINAFHIFKRVGEK